MKKKKELVTLHTSYHTGQLSSNILFDSGIHMLLLMLSHAYFCNKDVNKILASFGLWACWVCAIRQIAVFRWKYESTGRGTIVCRGC